jgi:hypothetical protein
MRLVITNGDSQRTAVVKAVDFNPDDPDAKTEHVTEMGRIQPGRTLEVWCHRGRKLEISEEP